MNFNTLITYLFTAFTFLVSTNCFAQVTSDATKEQVIEQNYPDSVFTEVDVVPSFIGGQNAFVKYIYDNFQAQINLIIDTSVLTSFIVEKDGTLSNIKIIKDPGFKIGKEVLRLLKKSPKWKPGLINDQPVRTFHTLPVAIRLK